MPSNRHAHLLQLLCAFSFACTLTAALSACNITPQQGLQGLQAMGSVVVEENYRHQSKRLCSQQNDPALRYQCEQQAQKEFQQYQKQMTDKP
jgi:hypothetical protein